jgi:hypothetical protein
MAKAVAEAPKGNTLPAYLQGGKQTKFGNTDSTDFIIPRVKLLQAISPEVTENDGAKAGEFWHTIVAQSLGKELRGIPILVRKSFVLWSPRNDDRGILARANDGLHWDNADMEFTVKPKGSPNPVTYKLGKTVHDKIDGRPALSEFGSSIPGDANSPPAAALTYQMLWFFPDHPDLSPAIIINTRSSVKPAKALISRIDLMPVDSYGQVYKIGISQEQGDEGPYFNYKYAADGYAEQVEYERCKALYESFSTTSWRANDESEDVDKTAEGPKRTAGKSTSDKF